MAQLGGICLGLRLCAVDDAIEGVCNSFESLSKTLSSPVQLRKMSSTSSFNGSNVSSHMSVGELSLESVRFTSTGVSIEYDYGSLHNQKLNNIPHFVAAKGYNALPLEESRALNDSICRIWNAFVATDYKLNGNRNCVNHALDHNTDSNIDAGDGMLARVTEPFFIKGRIVGPDDDYPHLTKVCSDGTCDHVQLTPGVTYIIHGDVKGKSLTFATSRSEMLLLTQHESELRFGISDFHSPPLSDTVWSIKGRRLVGTFLNGLERLCREDCATKCDSKDCLNGQNRPAKFVYVKSDSPIKVYDTCTRYNPWGARSARRLHTLSEVLKTQQSYNKPQVELLRTAMVFKSLQDTIPANKCWVYPGKCDHAIFNPDKPYLKANAAVLYHLYPHDSDGDAVSLWDGEKVRVTTYGQVAHVCTKVGSPLEPGTQNFVWAGHPDSQSTHETNRIEAYGGP